MKQFETEHYVFNYASGSKAEQDIESIAAHQEACASYMCAVLGMPLAHKLQYFLCETAQEVGEMNQGVPVNGLAVYPDKIYAVYNEEVQCIFFHEDAHLISFMWADPNPYNPAVEEGFAMFFDRKWWGIHNLDWVGYFLKSGKYIPITKLLDADGFYALDDRITYPIVGAFTEWLVSYGGMERYHDFFEKRDVPNAMQKIYGKTPEEMNEAFVKYTSLFKMDEELEQRMAELAKDW